MKKSKLRKRAAKRAGQRQNLVNQYMKVLNQYGKSSDIAKHCAKVLFDFDTEV